MGVINGVLVIRNEICGADDEGVAIMRGPVSSRLWGYLSSATLVLYSPWRSFDISNTLVQPSNISKLACPPATHRNILWSKFVFFLHFCMVFWRKKSNIIPPPPVLETMMLKSKCFLQMPWQIVLLLFFFDGVFSFRVFTIEGKVFILGYKRGHWEGW